MLSIEEKAYGLSLLWKEAEYNCPFWSRLEPLDWDQAYRDALPRVLAADSLRCYYLELRRFLALLRDGHTDVSFPQEVTHDVGSLPIWIRSVQGKFIIDNADSSLRTALYSEILRINGMPVGEYYTKKIHPYCWHENERAAAWNINELIPLIEYHSDIMFETENGVFTVRPTQEKISWGKRPSLKPVETLEGLFSSKTHVISLTQDHLAVISIPTFEENTLPEEFYLNLPSIAGCRGYILDLRCNGGGNSNNGDAVAQTFIDGAFAYSCDKKMIHIGPYKAWGQWVDLDQLDQESEWGQKVYNISKKRYFERSTLTKTVEGCPCTLTAPLVVLANEETASAAEDLLVTLDYAKRAVIVGTPSYGSTGQPLFLDLPGGGRARICTRWCTYPDGKEFVNIGVQPHVFVEPSVDDLTNGRDVILETGLCTLRDRIKTEN